MSKSVQTLLEEARARGYLVAPYQDQEKLVDAWRVDCWRQRRPYLVALRGYRYYPRKLYGSLELELRGDWWLSRRIWTEATKAFEGVTIPVRWGNRLRIDELPHRDLDIHAHQLLSIVTSHRPGPDEAFDLPVEIVRGAAHCTYLEALEDRLNDRDTYHITEIPNMMGHVVIMTNNQPPMVGYHLERFDLLDPP